MAMTQHLQTLSNRAGARHDAGAGTRPLADPGRHMKTASVAIVYTITILAGTLGGCAVGSHAFLTRKQLQLGFVLAYGVIGAATSLGVVSYLLWSNGWTVSAMAEEQLHGLLMAASLSGMCGSTIMGSAYAISKLVLRYKGLEIQVTAAEKKGRDS